MISSPSPHSTDLLALARHYGLQEHYRDQNGQVQDVSTNTLLQILAELGVDLPSDILTRHQLSDDDEQHLHRIVKELDKKHNSLPPTITAISEESIRVLCTIPDFSPGSHPQASVELSAMEGTVPLLTPEGSQLELPQGTVPCTVLPSAHSDSSSSSSEIEIHIPPLPSGWHKLNFSYSSSATGENISCYSTVLCAPQKLSLPHDIENHPAVGVMTQLYSIRDHHSWGMGDFHTLRTLADQLQGIDFLLINPIHAAEPLPPLEDSPYLPTSRRFINPLYLHIEDIPEYHAHPEIHEKIAALKKPLTPLNKSSDLLERNTIYKAKMESLLLLFQAGLSPQRSRTFRQFLQEEGESLTRFSHWCAQYTTNYISQNSKNSLHAEDSLYQNLRNLNLATLEEFYCWMQFLCSEQAYTTQQYVLSGAKQRIGIMADLAVGIHPAGADAHIFADYLVHGASVGAPPDGYNQQGQDWSQPPWHPHRLAEAGYAPWRDMIRSILRYSGALRIDHILGMFRLWWIPRGQSPTTGCYVHYDHEAMISALILEASRRQALLIGEDLGTFEPWVQEYLASRGIMGTSILWFEGTEKGPKPLSEYRRLSLTSVNTHDLPPTASYLEGGHIALREKLGVLTRPAEEEYADDARWQVEVLRALAHQGAMKGLPCERYFMTMTLDPERNPELSDPRHGREKRPEGIIQALHRAINLTPSLLKCISLVDLVEDRSAQNQPGTTQDMYPNWRQPLRNAQGHSVLIEDLSSYPLVQDILPQG